MAHKEAKTTSGFVIFLLLSVKEFRTSLFALSLFFFTFHFLSSLSITGLTSLYSSQIPIHLSIQPFIFFFTSNTFFLISLNPKSVYHFMDHKSLKLFNLSAVLSAVFFLHLSVCASIIYLSSCPSILLPFSQSFHFLFCPFIDPSIHPSVRHLVYRL